MKIFISHKYRAIISFILGTVSVFLDVLLLSMFFTGRDQWWDNMRYSLFFDEGLLLNYGWTGLYLLKYPVLAAAGLILGYSELKKDGYRFARIGLLLSFISLIFSLQFWFHY